MTRPRGSCASRVRACRAGSVVAEYSMPEVIFNGSDGRLEGRYVHGEGPTPPLAMILHPHSLHGGTMNNRIVYSLFHMFARRGFSVLRFNFRGVGRSQGVFDHGQ